MQPNWGSNRPQMNQQNNFNYFDSALTRAFSAAKIILYIGLMIACRIETARSEG